MATPTTADAICWKNIPSLEPLLRIAKNNPTAFDKRPPEWVNEFFLIEVLLRSPSTWNAQRKSADALRQFLLDHGLSLVDPLKGSHHALLTSPITVDQEAADKWARLGYVGKDRIIEDLGAMVKLTPDTRVAFGKMMDVGGFDGERHCLGLLHNPSPRFLCVRLDNKYKPETIISNLRPLLRQRHNLTKKLPTEKRFAFSDRQRKSTPFTVATWLKYLQCYDLRTRDKKSYGMIAHEVYGPTADREKAEKAVTRVRYVKPFAEHATAAIDGWPPHKIP